MVQVDCRPFQLLNQAFLNGVRRNEEQRVPGKQVIGKKVGQPLVVERRGGRAAFVQQMDAKPVSFRVIPPNKRQVGIAQAMFGQILPDSPKQYHLGRALLESLPDIQRQAKSLARLLHRQRFVLASLPGMGRRTGHERQAN